MIISSHYFEILGLSPKASLNEVKKAYRRIVRANHPDLFKGGEKDLQELKMVQINEAYARIIDGFKFDEHPSEDRNVGTMRDEGSKSSSYNNEVGFHRDVQYVYYRLGFDYFSKALHGIKGIDRNVQLRSDMYYLKRFSKALGCLRKSDIYFSILVNDYPNSIWTYDASVKIRRIGYFFRLYRKILVNIERNLRSKTLI